MKIVDFMGGTPPIKPSNLMIFESFLMIFGSFLMIFQSFLMIFDDFSLKLRGVRGAAAPRGPVFFIWGYPLDSQGSVIFCHDDLQIIGIPIVFWHDDQQILVIPNV